MRALLPFFALFSIYLYGCSDCTIDDSNIESLILKDSTYKEVVQTNPETINLYIDISGSMKNYITPSLLNSNFKLYENIIRGFYNNKLNATLILLGWGDSVYYLGKENEVIIKALDNKTYNKPLSKIDLVFNNIKNDTSTNTLNIIISDAIYEAEFGDNYGFLLGPNITNVVSNNKLFGLSSTSIGYYDNSSRKAFESPIHVFIAGNYNHSAFLKNNYFPLNDNNYIISPFANVKTKVNTSENGEIFLQNKNSLGVQLEDNSAPLDMKITIEQSIENASVLNAIKSQNLSTNIFETNLYCNEDGTVNENVTWKKSDITNTIVETHFNTDTTSEIIDIKFKSGHINESQIKLYRIDVVGSFPEWINQKYSTSTRNDINRTYRFNDLFDNLRNYLKENPFPLFSYYIIVKSK